MSEQDQHEEILKAISDLRNDVQPVLDVFKAFKFLGKWSAVAVAFLGSLTALALGVKALFKK